jgi:murein DD-endopeptidase MepM/ murein hydrolase activator NlpD
MVVTAYFDNGGTRDWSCGSVTYSGHRGTDFAPYGRFDAMDDGRDVVAAASGEVVAAHDGEFDRCTTGSCGGGGGFGNYVSVRHADGKVTYYAHLKRGSLRVGVGDRVDCGRVLGQIGSSGNSTGPHVHFEARAGGTADDPFGGGGCSGPDSWWIDQRAYRGLPGGECEVTAPPTPSNDDAIVDRVEVTPADSVAPDASVGVTVTMRNTGDTTWSDGESFLLTFDGGEQMGAPDQVRLGDTTVAPGATHSFALTLRAPAVSGEHVAQFRMDRYGTARFGATAAVRVVVAEEPPPEPPAMVDPDSELPPVECTTDCPSDRPFADPVERGVPPGRLVGRCSVGPPVSDAPAARGIGALLLLVVARRGRRHSGGRNSSRSAK